MTIVALVCLGVVALSININGILIGRQERRHARERQLLIDQILHLSGKTWTPPPAEAWTAPATGEPLVAELDWTPTPEQSPIYT